MNLQWQALLKFMRFEYYEAYINKGKPHLFVNLNSRWGLVVKFTAKRHPSPPLQKKKKVPCGKEAGWALDFLPVVDEGTKLFRNVEHPETQF
jgi:hypothetical protein